MSAAALVCALGLSSSWTGTLALAPVALDASAKRAAGVVPISADASVSEAAVSKAAELLDRLLEQSSPELTASLARSRAFVVIIPRAKKLTDLPEFASLRGVRLPDGRVWDDVRGVGFLWQQDGSFATAVGEENLLASPPDGYPKGYLLAHEVTHAVHELGLSAQAKRALEGSYADRKSRGLPFASDYAKTTVYEYFAVSAGPFFSLRLSNERDWPWIAAEDPGVAGAVKAAYGDSRALWQGSAPILPAWALAPRFP
jgi:hypothetical protein